MQVGGKSFPVHGEHNVKREEKLSIIEITQSHVRFLSMEHVGMCGYHAEWHTARQWPGVSTKSAYGERQYLERIINICDEAWH